MKCKRLDRDSWPDILARRYVQRRLDVPGFRGLAALLTIEAVARPTSWTFPDGSVPVCVRGARWLQLLPDGENHMITAIYPPGQGVALWYIDITDGYYPDADGVAVYRDLYLDFIVRPSGDFRLVDMDELEEALVGGDISREQHASALAGAERVRATLLCDLSALAAACDRLLARMEAV